MYLFGVHGEKVDSFLGKMGQEGEVRRWVEKEGSVEMCLWEIARFMIRLV